MPMRHSKRNHSWSWTNDLNLDGWSADYQDPSTYLNPFNSEDGFYLKILGLDPSKDTGKIASLGLDQYTQKLKTADAEKYRRC